MKSPISRTLLVILALIMATIFGCTGTAKPSSTERAEALVFYKALNLTYSQLQNVMTDWNTWSRTASQAEYDSLILLKSKSYRNQLKMLRDNTAALSAPAKLQSLKESLISALDKGIEVFDLTQQYVQTRQEADATKVEKSQADYNKLMVIAAQKWDSGLDYYKIEVGELFSK